MRVGFLGSKRVGEERRKLPVVEFRKSSSSNKKR